MTNIELIRTELNETRTLIDTLCDKINTMMSMSNDCLDFRDAKDKLSEVETELVEKYNEYATRNN